MNRRRLFIPAFIVFLASGCQDAKYTVAPGDISFSADVQPIFSARCALPGCHIQPSPQAGMDLSPGHSYGNIVNVPAVSLGAGLRVKPNEPDSSVLYRLIAAGTMPAQGNPLLSSQVETIRIWIEKGAKDD